MPIGQFNSVPYQRITKNEIFNLGVVAFSKDGIEKVQFAISGQAYLGPTPLQATTMSLNPRTDTYEYWVPIKATDFQTDGTFSVKATIHGNDGGVRHLDKLNFIINATGKLSQPTAWVSKKGNNSTGIIGSKSKPFSTIGAAVNAIQSTADNGNTDGAIIFLQEGTYVLGSGVVKTVNEWLTLARANNATIEKTIINGSGLTSNTHLIKVDGLTLQSIKNGGYVFKTGKPDKLWIHNSRLIGFDRHTKGSNPVKHTGMYITNSYIYNVDRAIHGGILARGLTIEHIGEDAFQNSPFLVNIRVNDLDPGNNTYWHADGYQSWGKGPQNRIIYNYYGTNMHYQGLFMRATGSQANNNAFVNIFMEMAKPGRSGKPGGNVILSNGAMYGPWNHTLVWHCTFPSSSFYINKEIIGYGFTNSSFIGNLFWEFRDAKVKPGEEPSYSTPGNPVGNDFLYNHFIRSFTDVSNCNGNPQPPNCPQWFSKSPDSAPNGSQSVGPPFINLTKASTMIFGSPLKNSPLVNRIPFKTVPADSIGNLRDNKPDVGALEFSQESLHPQPNDKIQINKHHNKCYIDNASP